ncbi:MAG TPA: response regulator [Kofleriaceae bacterium]|jgi:DNA-binding response OmpR family regulator
MNASSHPHDLRYGRTRTTPVVLVADDDPLLRRLIALALGSDGFRVLDAGDGGELDAWVRRMVVDGTDPRCVDLVIADQRMSGATGLEVLARLRRTDWATPFILITGLDDPAIKAEAHRLGASCVIEKPFDLFELRAVARRLAMPEAPCRRST